jgi:hypothetical protein
LGSLQQQQRQWTHKSTSRSSISQMLRQRSTTITTLTSVLITAQQMKGMVLGGDVTSSSWCTCCS